MATCLTEADLVPGLRLVVAQKTNTISGLTYDVEVRVIRVHAGTVYYRLGARGYNNTPVERFLDIVNNQPKRKPY